MDPKIIERAQSWLTDQYPTKAKRPTYSVLDLNKIKAYTGLEIPFWKDSLKKCLKELGV